MPFDLVRKMLVGVLMLMLALPAWSMHVCRCARQGVDSATAANAAVKSETPQRPCCAKRLAEAAKTKSTRPELKSRCCCSEIRWNQTSARLLPDKVNAPSPESITSLEYDATSACQPLALNQTAATRGQVRAGPEISALILHCRFLI